MLFITAFPPNNKSGGQLFTYNVLNDLKQYFDIDLFYFSYPGHEYNVIPGVTIIKDLEPSIRNSIRRPYVFPLFTKRLDSGLIKYIKSNGNRYDVLYFDFSQVAYLSKYVKHKCKVIRCHDVIAQRYFRINRILFWWSKVSEARVLMSANKVFVPSEKDSQIIKSLYDIDSMSTHEYIVHYTIPKQIEKIEGYILFGVWSRKENFEGLVWFVDNVMKSKKKQFNDKIYIMGGGLDSEYKKKELDPLGIDYLGFVDDCYTEIVKRKAMIVPLFKGAGIKVKVLDSYSTGTPVIGTDVAMEGIPSVEGLENRVNTVDEFINCLNTFTGIDINEKRQYQREFVLLYDNKHMGELLNEFMEANE